MALQEKLTAMQLDKQKIVTFLEELEHHDRKLEMKLRVTEEENTNMGMVTYCPVHVV